MTLDRQQQQFRSICRRVFRHRASHRPHDRRDLSAHARPRRADARLMRAARAVGAGKLDVFVPSALDDELGLLTHTFNHMTQRLSESQARSRTYQRTLEEKVAQRTHELEIATAHAYKLRSTTFSPGCRTGRCSTSG
jgi:HAMP domain-containing protein